MHLLDLFVSRASKCKRATLLSNSICPYDIASRNLQPILKYQGQHEQQNTCSLHAHAHTIQVLSKNMPKRMGQIKEI